MDPVAALESILCGHMVADHADALRDWLSGGGFEPEVLLSVDCHEFFATHCTRQYGNNDPRRVKANGIGIWTYDRIRDDWWLAASWSHLRQLEDIDF